jgi:SRSO17 transposase
LRQALTRQGAAPWGQAEGVLVFAPSACAKAGAESVGGARQWCGRWGTVDHGQGALSLGYVSATDHSLVARRLSLPKEGTDAKARLDKAGVPHDRRG